MSESIAMQYALSLRDGTPVGNLLEATAHNRYAVAIKRHGNAMTADSEMKYDPATKALEHMVDTILYATKAKLAPQTIACLKSEARCLALDVIRKHKEAQAIARAGEVAGG